MILYDALYSGQRSLQTESFTNSPFESLLHEVILQFLIEKNQAKKHLPGLGLKEIIQDQIDTQFTLI